jgi:TPR repeat protein
MLLGLLGLLAGARAADDTSRFYGTWTGSFSIAGQTVTIRSVHDASGYHNYIVAPTGDVDAGSGTFSAADGQYYTNAPPPNDTGTYRFADNDIAVCTNAAGQTVTWKRVKSGSAPAPVPVDANVAAKKTTGYVPPSGRPGNPSVNPTPPAPDPQPGATVAGPEYKPDPSLPPETNAAIAAFNRKDFKTAWINFWAAAQKGDAEAEAGVGAMLFRNLNPPGTGFYAQSEGWLLKSANQGNTTGMTWLGQYYFERGRSIGSGINPGANNSVSPAERKEADAKFVLARQWFERAANKGDVYAMGNLAVLLDGGVGGPPDKARAAQLREKVKAGPDTRFGHKATDDPTHLALNASWQSGHYAEALKSAKELANKGDASAQAMLGRAYYEGVGVQRDYATALGYLTKASAQKSPDAMFFLGLMYENGRGVQQDLKKAIDLFDEAGGMGQNYAVMEARGMRLQGEMNRLKAAQHGQSSQDIACGVAGGTVVGWECIRGGETIDPFKFDTPEPYEPAVEIPSESSPE